MPSSTTFDHPSLILGHIVNPLILATLKKISGLQSSTDAAQEKMNSYVLLKRSLDMTVNELLDMDMDVSELTGKLKEIDASIVKSAADYATTRLANETAIQALKEQLAGADNSDTLESPVDFDSSEIRKMPLSSDSLKLDAQYFSYEDDSATATVSAIESYIRNATGSLGSKASADIARTASTQITQQQKNHSLSGTLIITASCTHKDAAFLSPCVLDADKAVTAWNTLFPDSPIDTGDKDKVEAVAAQENDNGKGFTIVSGANYGSSFVGMVHILKEEAASATSMIDLADSLQERLTVGNWLEDAAGGFGIDSTFADDIKNLLNTQKIRAHVNIVVMGSIPSIRSNQLQMGIGKFTDIDLARLASSSSLLSSVTSGEKKTVSQGADAARTGARVMAMQNATIQGVLSGLGKIDQGANKIMDINTMMTAFEDYLEEVKKGEPGIPVSFYFKPVSQRQLARLWMSKYYPESEKEEGKSAND